MSELESKANLGMKVLDWFALFLKKPEGKVALIVIFGSLAFGFFWGNSRYDKGIEAQKKNDSILIAGYKTQIAEYKNENKVLTENNLSQQQRLENRDCTEEVRKYRLLFNELSTKTAQDATFTIAQREKETQERILAEQSLKIEKQKTKELQQLKQLNSH